MFKEYKKKINTMSQNSEKKYFFVLKPVNT